jgi:hypothetical protein
MSVAGGKRMGKSSVEGIRAEDEESSRHDNAFNHQKQSATNT